MKIIKEDIENLERYIGNSKVDVHAELPLIMADAYEDSKKRQEEIDKELEEKDKDSVELNKVIGAEEQPVPDLPKEPNVTLEESLFEDYDSDGRHYSDMLFDMIEEGSVNVADIAKDLIYWCSEDDIKKYMEVNQLTSEFIDDEELEENLNESSELQNERVKNIKSYLEKALSVVNSYLDRIDESLTEDTAEDPFYVMLKMASDRFDVLLDNMEKMENLSNYVEEQEFLTLKDANQILHQIRGRYLFDDEEVAESLTEDTEEDRYYAALDIPKGPERKKVAAERRQEFLKKYDLEDRAQEWKDAKGKGDPEEEEDLFTRINDELFPYDMEEVKLWTKFKDVPASKRYHDGDIGTDYDGNILVWADEDEDFEFAKKVANAYGVDITEPKQSGKHKIVKIIVSEE